MPKVDWSYHRKNCNSCSKAASFLSEHTVTVVAQEDARATPLVDSDALKLLASVDQLYVTRGTKVLHLDLKRERPDDQTLLDLTIGRSGKLRAPTLKVGRTLMVGFDQATYETLFALKS